MEIARRTDTYEPRGPQHPSASCLPTESSRARAKFHPFCAGEGCVSPGVDSLFEPLYHPPPPPPARLPQRFSSRPVPPLKATPACLPRSASRTIVERISQQQPFPPHTPTPLKPPWAPPPPIAPISVPRRLFPDAAGRLCLSHTSRFLTRDPHAARAKGCQGVKRSRRKARGLSHSIFLLFYFHFFLSSSSLFALIWNI